MRSPWFSLLRTTVVTTAVLFLGWNASRSVLAQTAPPSGGGTEGYGPLSPTKQATTAVNRGQEGTAPGMGTTSPVLTPGLFEVVCPAGCYGGAFHYFGCRAYSGPGYYGFFHRYWAYGTYGPNYYFGPNPPQTGLASGDLYVAIRRGHGRFKHRGAASSPVACADGAGIPMTGGETNPPVLPAEGPARRPPEKLPQSNNTALLQLLVPENAEVLVEGRKTTTTGTVRDFESPPLQPGKNMTYAITVRYPDADGKTIEETHSIRVRANDQLRIDCTKPEKTEQPRATVLRP